MFHRGDCQIEHLLPTHFEFILQVDIGGGQKEMDSGIFAALQGLPGGIDILLVAAGQCRYLDTTDIVGDILDAAEVALGGNRETCLDDIDIQLDKLLGQPEFLLHIHAGPW